MTQPQKVEQIIKEQEQRIYRIQEFDLREELLSLSGAQKIDHIFETQKHQAKEENESFEKKEVLKVNRNEIDG